MIASPPRNKVLVTPVAEVLSQVSHDHISNIKFYEFKYWLAGRLLLLRDLFGSATVVYTTFKINLDGSAITNAVAVSLVVTDLDGLIVDVKRSWRLAWLPVWRQNHL